MATASRKFKNINQMDYDLLLSRVNTAICQYNNTSDQTEQAILFIQKIDEISTSRPAFFNNMETRLLKLLDPNNQLTDWFKSKKSSLETVLKKIKLREAADANFLLRYTPEVREGLRCLEDLLDVDDLGYMHVGDIMKVKRTLADLQKEAVMKNEAAATYAAMNRQQSASSTNTGSQQTTNGTEKPIAKLASQPLAATVPPFEAGFFYLFLHGLCLKLGLHLDSRDAADAEPPSSSSSTTKANVELPALYASLAAWHQRYSKEPTCPLHTDRAYAARVQTVLALLAELVKIGKQARLTAAMTADAGDSAAVDGLLPRHKLQLLRAVAADLKPQEWAWLRARTLKEFPATTGTAASGIVGASSASGGSKGLKQHPVDAATTELERIANKRRKLTDDVQGKGRSAVAGGAASAQHTGGGGDEDEVDGMERIRRFVAAEREADRIAPPATGKHRGVVYVPDSLYSMVQ